MNRHRGRRRQRPVPPGGRAVRPVQRAGGRSGGRLGGPGAHLGRVAVPAPRHHRPRAARAVGASLVTILAVGMLVAAVATAALGVLTTRLATVVGQHVMHDLRVGVYAHLQQMSLKFFTKARAGDLQSRLANDIGGVDNVVTSTASGTVQSALGALAVAIAALVMNWRLGLLCLVVVPLFLAVLDAARPAPVGTITRSRARKQAGLAALVEETLSISGVLLTKTTGGQQTLIERFSAESRRLGDTEVELAMAGRWQLASRRAAADDDPRDRLPGRGSRRCAQPPRRLHRHGGRLLRACSTGSSHRPRPCRASGVAYSTSMALFGRIFEVLDLPIDVATKPGAQATSVDPGRSHLHQRGLRVRRVRTPDPRARSS